MCHNGSAAGPAGAIRPALYECVIMLKCDRSLALSMALCELGWITSAEQSVAMGTLLQVCRCQHDMQWM